jgi:cytochrome c oxidase assembly protein subunit 15
MNSSGAWQFSLQTGQALIWLALLALVCWLGLKASFSKLAGLLLFLTFDLVVFGAFVRLSDAGLGCPDWPGCYAQFAPLSAANDIAAAVAAQGGEHGWVSATKAWIEMIHRYWASFIGMLLIVLLAKAGFEKRRDASIKLGLPIALLLVVIAQGLFGKFTVTMKLMPVIVTTHLLGGMLLLSLLVLLYFRYHKAVTQISVSASLKSLTLLSLMVLVLQIALGGWVSTNYAALACAKFPLCQGSVWPLMDFASGFDLTRAMGQTSTGSVISLQALTAIHFVHRHFAYVVTLIVGILAWRLWHEPALKRYGIALMHALMAQMLIGIGTVVFDQPLLLAVAHNAGAAFLLSVLVATAYKIRVLL